MSSTSPTPVQPGEILAGKYRIERVLGAGGMGVVVAAMHLHLDQRVAIKFLLPEAMQDAAVVARFGREARAASRLKSPHVARVIDVGELANGSPYMVMEYLEGHDLAAELSERGPLPLADAVDYLAQAGEAIAEAHALGIVHRDLKPANLFLTKGPDGTALVKLLDFGISKPPPGSRDSKPELSLTKTGSMMGSPVYMSPEQLRSSRDVDARTDVWALGIILHELLAGQPPFAAESFPQLVGMIFLDEPMPLAELRPELPAAVTELARRSLAKNAADRTPSVLDFVTALAPFGPPSAQVAAERIARIMGAEPPPATVATPAVTEPVASVTTNLPGASTVGAWDKGSDTRLEASAKSRTSIWLAAGAGALALGGAAAFALSRPAPPPPAALVVTPETAVPSAASVPEPPLQLAPPAALAVAPTPAESSSAAPPAPSAAAPAALPVGKRPSRPAHPPATTAAAVTTPTPAPAPTPAPTSPAPKNPLKVDIK